jgi:diguanylate cyclase (GGDEF)-like protein
VWALFRKKPQPVPAKPDELPLTKTIASTATLKLVRIPESDYFYTPIEERFERLTRLARRAFNVPVAAVTLINAEKQWFKSINGWIKNELPIEASLCTLTLQAGKMTVIEDTTQDPRTQKHPLVVEPPNFRFYAGQPLYDENNAIIGTFCLFDVRSRAFSETDRQTLTDIATMSQREFLADELRDAHTALTTKLGVARREAMMDHLTRLWNSRGASVLLKAAFDSADRNGTEFAVALLDLDNFKQINDTHGHQVGDEVLRRVASLLVSSVRGSDAICRVGGDEFLVLMTETSAEVAATVADRIQRAVTESLIPTRQGPIRMSTSVGVSVRKPKEATTLDELIARADKGLMAAKSRSRGPNR